jgi:hypothetical protein
MSNYSTLWNFELLSTRNSSNEMHQITQYLEHSKTQLYSSALLVRRICVELTLLV